MASISGRFATLKFRKVALVMIALYPYHTVYSIQWILVLTTWMILITSRAVYRPGTVPVCLHQGRGHGYIITVDHGLWCYAAQVPDLEGWMPCPSPLA